MGSWNAVLEGYVNCLHKISSHNILSFKIGGCKAEPNREIVSCRACAQCVVCLVRSEYKTTVRDIPLPLFPSRLSPAPNLLSSFRWFYRYHRTSNDIAWLKQDIIEHLMMLLLRLLLVLSLLDGAWTAPKKTPEEELRPRLEDELLFLVTEGQSSYTRMNRLARSIVKYCRDVPTHVKQLANLLSKNNRKDTLERAVSRWARRQVWGWMMPEPYQFLMTVKAKGKSGKLSRMRTGVLLPHEMVGTVNEYPELFEFLMGSTKELFDFWKGTAETDRAWMDGHPTLNAAEDINKIIPIGIHGDDAGIFQGDKYLVVSWNSCAAQGRTTLDNRILFACILYNRLVEGVSLNQLYRVLVWSLDALATGRYPHKDHDGKEFSKCHHPDRARMAGEQIADGYCGAFSEMRGDWKFLKETFNLKEWWKAKRVCHLCRAHKKTKRLHFTQFRRDAHVRKTRLTAEQWNGYYGIGSGPHCPLAGIDGFCIWRVWADALHVLDLGVLQIVVVCCLWELSQKATKV